MTHRPRSLHKCRGTLPHSGLSWSSELELGIRCCTQTGRGLYAPASLHGSVEKPLLRLPSSMKASLWASMLILGRVEAFVSEISRHEVAMDRDKRRLAGSSWMTS